MASQGSKVDLIAADKLLAGDLFVSTETYDNLVVLCDDFGSRFGGTPGERLARDFLLDKMRSYGLDAVHSEDFEYLGWIRGPAMLRSITPIERTFPCISLPYTHQGVVEADLVDLGHGSASDFGRLLPHVATNLVLVTSSRLTPFNRRQLFHAEKYGRAVQAGAAGFIWMRDAPGMLEETGCLRFNQAAEIPGVGVSREVGEMLLRLGKRGRLKLRLETTDQLAPMTSSNIIGELRGNGSSDRVFIVGAHLDGHDISQGAMDNAAGAVVLLEAARGLAQVRELLQSTVRFILFPVEDIGMIGSHAYVNAHRNELERASFMLNLDGPGVDDDKVILLQGCPELQIPMDAAVRSMGQTVPVIDQVVHPFTDFFPFMLAGVPSATVAVPYGSSVRFQYGHTAADTIDKVSSRALQLDAILVARLILRITQVDPWPGQHRTWQEVRDVLGTHDLLDTLRLEARYPFLE